MHMLLANRKVCTQIWPSTQLSDDLSGALEYVSVAWPGYLECRHVPGPSQTLPSQRACCLLLWPGPGRGRTLGISKPEGVKVGHCAAEDVHRASAYITVAIFIACVRILDSQDPSQPLLLSGFGHSTHRVSTTPFPVLSPSALPPGQVGPWPPGGSRGALLQIILFYSEMAFNLQIFIWQMMGRCSFVSYKRGTCDQHLWTDYLFLYFFGPRSNYF